MIENKIFVVILVLSTVVTGLAGFLFWLERRISKMEKSIKQDQEEG